MVKRVFAWLNGAPGRKRGIAAVLGASVALMTGFDAAFDKLCGAELLSGNLCSIDLLAWSSSLDSFWTAMEPALTGTASLATVVMAAWGWMQARSQGRA